MKLLKTPGRDIRKSSLLVGCEIEANFLANGPSPLKVVPSVKVFLKNPSLYFREFWKKQQKTLEAFVVEHDRRLNPNIFFTIYERLSSWPLTRREKLHDSFKLPYHLQATERCVKLVKQAADIVCREHSWYVFIRSQTENCFREYLYVNKIFSGLN